MTRNNKGQLKNEYPGKNYQGVKLGSQKTDWIAGADSPLKGDSLLSTGNWKLYSSKHEHQVFNLGNANAYDTSLCTQFAGTDAIEHLMNLLGSEGLIPPNILTWLNDNDYWKEGKFEISERLGGANSGMTTSGTYLYKMANSIRKLGIVPQDKLPLAENFEDNINPELIPDEIYLLGKNSKDYIKINWNWIFRKDVSEALKQAPLVCTVKYADPTSPDQILRPEGRHNHAVLLVNEENGYYEIDDSYFRQYKRYDKNYVGSFLQFHITFNTTNMDTNEFIQKHDTHIIRNINTGAYGVVYGGNFLKVTDDRAGIFTLDRLTRNYEMETMIPITDEEWNQLDKDNLYF